MKTALSPYTKRKTEDLITEAITMKLAIVPTETTLDQLLAEIKRRAEKDKKSQVETKSGGRSWTKDDGRGIAITVSFPADKRKALDDAKEAQKIAGKHFHALFKLVYKPVKGFADEARKLLTRAKAATLIDLATEENKPRISFAIKGAPKAEEEV